MDIVIIQIIEKLEIEIAERNNNLQISDWGIGYVIGLEHAIFVAESMINPSADDVLETWEG